MKSTIQRVLVAVAVATVGAGAVALASAQSTAATPSSSAPGAGRHHGHHHLGGGRFVGTLLRATKQLNLTADQQSTIRSLVKGAHTHQGRAQVQGADETVTGNPSDPGFAAAVQNAQTTAATRVQKESALAGQIYGVLTTAQKNQLPTVLASLKAQDQARRAAWAAKHTNTNS
jgi:Spy/CpxP family protein refolding chaperone